MQLDTMKHNIMLNVIIIIILTYGTCMQSSPSNMKMNIEQTES